MADRYQDRPYPAPDDYGRGSEPHAAGRADSDPLAELARLIGQTDPFAMGRANAKPQPRAEQRAPAQPQYEQPAYENEPPAGPPPWMQRAGRQEAAPPPPPPQQDYYDEPEYQPSPVHPLHRYAAQHAAPPPQHAAPEPQYQQPEYQDQRYQDEQHYAQAEQPADPSRYDDALYGQIESGQDYQRDPAYPDDPYAYQNAYEEEPEEEPRKRGGLVTVAAVVALAVLGTSAAFAYRTFVGSPRSGEPPVIKADNSPTKVMPTADNAPKAPDRMALGDGAEKLVPREESPVDVNRSGPRVVFPPLNQNANPPPPSSVAPSATVPPAANGTLPNGEPRRIRTLTVKGDQNDAGAPANAAAAPPRPAPPAVAPATPAPRANVAPAAPAQRNPASANASANGPLSLTPGAPAAAEPPARVAAANPAPAASGGGYIVQVSSQKSEADAQASYRVLQSKYGSVLGSRSPVVKRVDLTDKGKGIVYRAYAGPFGSNEEAAQACNNLKAAGLSDCYIHRN